MASIHDVARLAGVSISTVSYALSGKRSIGESTRIRVNDAVEKLGYRAHAGARMLAGERTHILALAAPLHSGTSEPAHMAFVMSVARAAREHDYDVLLLTQDEGADGLQRVALSRLVDGIIVLDVSDQDERVDLIRSLDVPAIFVGVPRDSAGLVCVDMDFEAAATMSVERLAAVGHRSIALLGQSPALYDRGSGFPRRFRDAFLAAAADRGMAAGFAMADRDPANVRQALDSLLGTDPGVTGLVLHTDEGVQTTALGILRERGVRMPHDLSVLSACSSFSTEHFEPPLDTIPLVPDDSCVPAVALAVQQVGAPIAPRVELIPPRYVGHGSVVPPAA
ncbi:LacI family DNA-binding transcriptional regulator [Planctomonas psychrotolerans]|uniref:LacI family DNA-binding transcriptional regulator n=1 Tax=Planctomonas psychrotolerans TaxID=2528712 RepID=UPI001239034C|nr:LacI family DNA-binding transcriptional regulator [Planctomonas psychrotolerans]